MRKKLPLFMLLLLLLLCLCVTPVATLIAQSYCQVNSVGVNVGYVDGYQCWYPYTPWQDCGTASDYCEVDVCNSGVCCYDPNSGEGADYAYCINGAYCGWYPGCQYCDTCSYDGGGDDGDGGNGF